MGRRWWRPPSERIRSSLLSLPSGPIPSVTPQAVGCSCVSVFTTADGPVVAVARRSSAVLHSPSSIAVIPSFGLESNVVAGQESRFGLFMYNYLREFAEELFDLEELIHVATARRVHPDWNFELPQVSRVIEEVDGARVKVVSMGASINPYDGALDYALLAEFNSSDFLRLASPGGKGELGSGLRESRRRAYRIPVAV